jgi:hypothetical protein
MSLFLFVPLFIIAIFLAFYVPGKVVIGSQEKLSSIGSFTVSFILGIILWAWQGYLFGFLHLRWLSYIYLLIFLVLFLKKKYFYFKLPGFKFKNIDLFTILIIIVGIFGQTFQFIRNGQMTASGLFISNNNSVDQVWHLTLVEELVKRFPPFEPGMFGVQLFNYHFWFNLSTAELIRVFHLPIFQTQFNGMYVVGSVLLGLIVFAFVNAIYKSKTFLRLFLFFVYFSGDIVGWFMVFLKNRFDLDAGWLFENGTTFMDSPGRGFGTIISLAGLYLLFVNKQQVSKRNILIIGLLFGSLMGFKVYFAIPLIFGLFCFTLFKVLKKKFPYFFIFIISSILFLIQFLPLNANSGGLFLVPFDIPREFFAQNTFGLSYLDMRWRIYFDHQNYLRLAEYGILMSIGYLFIQFSVKLLGFFPLKKTINKLGLDFYILLYSSLIFSLILGLFFYQRVGGANIWEFFMVSSLILAIIASLNISLYLPKNKIIASLLIIFIIVLVIPRWFNSTYGYLRTDYFSGFHGISNQELMSYDYLKKNTPQDSTVLLIGQKNYILYSSIVNVLTQRNLFLSGAGVGQVITPEIKRRKQIAEIVEFSIDTNLVDTVLQKDNISYIYINANSLSVLPVSTVSSNLREVFSNQAAKIYKVN